MLSQASTKTGPCWGHDEYKSHPRLPKSRDRGASVSGLLAECLVGWLRWGDRTSQERQPAWSPIPTHALINRQRLPTASFHRTHSWVSYSVFFCPIFLASPWRVLPNSPSPLATRNLPPLRALWVLRILFPQLWQALSSFPSRAISIYPSRASSENSWLNGPFAFCSLQDIHVTLKVSI